MKTRIALTSVTAHVLRHRSSCRRKGARLNNCTQYVLIIICMLALLFFAYGCDKYGATAVTLLYTGDVLGELEPCG